MDESVASWVFDDEPEPKSERTTSGKKSTHYFQPVAMARAAEEVGEMICAKDWSAATPRHFVAVYHLLHERVYGFAPSTTTQDRVRGAMLAGMTLKRQFGGDPERMAEFVQWIWDREQWREKMRKAKNEPAGGFRLGVRLQFSAGMVDDYRAAMLRQRVRSK